MASTPKQQSLDRYLSLDKSKRVRRDEKSDETISNSDSNNDEIIEDPFENEDSNNEFKKKLQLNNNGSKSPTKSPTKRNKSPTKKSGASQAEEEKAEASSAAVGKRKTMSKSICEEEDEEEEDEGDEYIRRYKLVLNYECDTATSIDDFRPSENHTVLFDHNSLKYSDHTGPPDPLTASIYVDQWDNEAYVKLPFSEGNVDDSGQKKWEEIARCLTLLSQTLVEDPDSEHIENAIKQYNPEFKNFNFEILHYIFDEELEGDRGETVLKELVPKIIKLALSLPAKIGKAIPLLRSGMSHSVSLSQEQCACLLANAFFCTLPNENDNQFMPYANFVRIYGKSRYERKRESRKVEKLKCLLHYFQRVTDSMPEGVLTFTRQCIAEEDMPKFRESAKPIRTVVIRSKGTIEDCAGALQMDFANKYLGGGVLGSGCVQEEIRFLICPELIVSLLLFERLEPNESAIIKGCERFSSYMGYGNSFEWSDDYQDFTPKDLFSRMYTHVVAVDALAFNYTATQYHERKILRELNKAYVGFVHSQSEQLPPKSASKAPQAAAGGSDVRKSPVIATGNWGCGAFRGNKQLKFLIQVMSAAEAERDLIFFTFGEKSTYRELHAMLDVLQREKLSVGQIYKLIDEYALIVGTLKADELDDYDLRTFLVRKFK